MSLPHVILSQILENSEMTGYDISVKFNRGNAGLIWAASHQQVYRELTKLEKIGFVKHSVHPQVGKPDRKVYKITELGENKLKEWIPELPKEDGYRDKLAAKVYNMKNSELKSCLDVLVKELRFVREEQERIKKYTPEDYVDEIMQERRMSYLNWRFDSAVKMYQRLKGEAPKV